jgi:ribonuclease HI
MAAKKQKYYVVWVGHTPGIYTTWKDCEAQVKNYTDARYKSFDTKQEATEAFSSAAPSWKKAKSSVAKVSKSSRSSYIAESISVDAACSGNPGLMEYQGVWTSDQTRLFHFGPQRDGTNNIGEFLAIVHALAMLHKKHDQNTPIYSDSKIAISWVLKKKANTKLERTPYNHELFDMISRAEKWLHAHTWKNPLLKWETKYWGENPADFGRK